MLLPITLRRITYLGSTRSQAAPRLQGIIILTVSVGVVSRGADRVINNMVVFILIAGQIIVKDHRPHRTVTGGQHLFSHLMGAQTPPVRQRLLILNLAIIVVEHGHGLTAIKHPQAVVTPTAQPISLPIATAVPVRELVLPHQMTTAQEHERVATRLPRVVKRRKGRIPITGTRPHRLHRQRRPQLLRVHPLGP